MNYKTILKKCLEIFCFLIILFTCSCKNLFPQITDEEAEEVKSVCTNLKAPPSFVKTRQTDRRETHAADSALNYSSVDPPEQVEEYFVNSLTKSGWNYTKETDPASIYLRFKKGKYSIDIELPKFSLTSSKVYLVDCSVGLD